MEPHHAKDDREFEERGSIHSYRQPLDEFVRSAILKKIVDGDTLRLDIDLGFGAYLTHDVRLSGCDTPEARGKESAAGLWVAERVKVWFNGNTELMIHSKVFKTGKWGRCLCEVWAHGSSLNAWLLSKGYAWPTDSSGRIRGGRDIERLSLPSSVLTSVRMGS